MMNQGMLGPGNPSAAPPNPMGMNGMAGGMNNLLAQQNMMMNPAAAIAGMGNLNAMGNAMGGMGMDGINGNSLTNPAVAAPVGMGNATNAPPAPSNNNKAPATGNENNGNDILAQLMQNPMAAQMMAQGLNPMVLLGGMGGLPGMGQSQFPGMGVAAPGAAANPLSALSLGMNGFGTFPSGLGNTVNIVADTNPSSIGGHNNAMMPSVREAAVPPHPNALFAFGNNNHMAIPQAMTNLSATITKAEDRDGSLIQHPTPNGATGTKAGKKQTKKMKVKGKPKRPLSAYNFFFRAERSRILDSLPKGDSRRKKRKKKKDENDDDEDKEDNEDEKDVVVKKEPSNENADSNKQQDNAKDDAKPKKGKANGKDSKDYDQVGNDGKKIPHGKIGFENLAKLIGKRWQELDAEGIEKYKKLAEQDMARYKKEMEAFLTKEAQGGIDGDLNSTMSTPGFYSMMHQKRKKSISDDDDSEEMGSKKKKRSKETLVKKEDDGGRVEV